MTIQARLDEAFARAEKDTLTALSLRLPQQLLARLQSWKFGEYGWISPVNLIMTAAWYKWILPSQDVCRIWARDHTSVALEGGFAIRSNDERYTVPLVTKKRLSSGFCSPNSGMQGSRAIEKMRGAGRIERDSLLNQSVSFDMRLFQNIMNDINECSADQAFDVFCWLLRKGLDIKAQRDSAMNDVATANVSNSYNLPLLLQFTKELGDPQFVRIVAAFLAQPVISNVYGDITLEGLDGAKTAADTQSKSPGDFWFVTVSGEIIGAEVKDRSKKIGFDVLSSIENRRMNNPRMTQYLAISASNSCVSEENLNDPDWRNFINSSRSEKNLNINCISLDDLSGLSLLHKGSVSQLVKEISNQLSKMTDLKNHTVPSWHVWLVNSHLKHQG